MSLEKTTEECFREYNETQSLEMRNEIVERNLYIAETLANKYTGKGIDYEDLFQVASYALIMAVMHFDARKGFQFATYATPKIIGEIKNYFRDSNWPLKVPRSLKERSMITLEAIERLQEKNQRIPTVREIAEHIDISDEEVLEALDVGRAYTTYSLENDVNKYHNEEIGYEGLETSSVFERVATNLTNREKEILQKRFLMEISQREAAEDLGVSQMTVSRIEKAMNRKFRAEYYRQ